MNHHQFIDLLNTEDDECNDLVFSAHGLSHERVLQKFPRVLTPIQDFFETKDILAKYSIIKDNKGGFDLKFSHYYHTTLEKAQAEAPKKRKAYW